MSGFKHTKGPWIFSNGYIGSRHCAFVSCDRNKYDGMHIHNGEINGEMTEESEANARLIAAAPEMLDALIDFVRWHKKQFEDNDGCPFNCACEGSHDCYECIHVKFCNYTNIIERATGMSIDEAIQAWEAHND